MSDREKEIRERPLTAEEARIKAWNEDHATGYSEAWGERSWSRNANRHDAYAIGFADGAEYQRTNDETDAQVLLAEIERLKEPSTILRRVLDLDPSLPKIVCLCGSSRFRQEYEYHADRLTHEGCIVLTIHCFKGQHAEVPGMDEAVRESLDELHKRKIDLAVEIFVVNVGGYIGDSTRSEIAYAQKYGKTVTYLEPLADRLDSTGEGKDA